MSFTGIEQITYGVDNLADGKRFFGDWGLGCVVEENEQIIFTTQNSAQIVLKDLQDATLPPAFESGPTIREVIWGVNDIATLQTLSNQHKLSIDDDGVCRCTDPNGLAIGFRVSERIQIKAKGAAINTYDQVNRIDQPAPLYESAQPVSIGHIVVFTDKLDQLERFYCDQFGFQVSDRYPNRGVFLRCKTEGPHHNLFLLQLPNGKVGLNHVAFVVRDIHEVFGGGLHMSRCNWETELGPGRHPISSAYFWYFKNPCGGTVEYYADEDYLTENWQAREFEPSRENFAEWAISKGLDGHSRRENPLQ